MESIILFYGLLFLVAFLYASVGHGGASGYLALMAIFSIAPDVMKPTALLLNLFVSLTSFIQFYRGKHFNWKDIFTFCNRISTHGFCWWIDYSRYIHL